MSRYLTFVAAHTHTRGNDLLAYLVLAVAVCALPGAVLFFVLLSIIAAVVAVASAVATAASYTRDGLGSLLYAGRVLLADRLHLIADGIDPRADDTPEPEPVAAAEPVAEPAAVEVPVVAVPVVEAPAPEPVPEPEALPLPLPVPVAMPSAAQMTVEAPAPAAHTDESDAIREALASAGSVRGAAKALGVGESTLRGRMKRHGIEGPKGKARGRKVEATADVAA